MYKALRPLFFTLNAERSHDLTIAALGHAGKSGVFRSILPTRIQDPVSLMGLEFPNRVGLAAGLDKNARCVHGMEALGFGFLEVGTVTPKPQPGNPKPRLFRLVGHQAIINRMGFNNDGVEALVERVTLARSKSLHVPLGINIGKNKTTDQALAVNDFLYCLDAVAEVADYVTVNLSSPNTPGLRDLQFGPALNELLAALSEARERLADKLGKSLPMLVKVAPDMAKDDLLHVADQLVAFGYDGIIATNTTIDRTLVKDSCFAKESGGLSGKVLMASSTDVVRSLASHLQKAIAIVGVGGINSAEDAVAKVEAGADLVQLYTGLIYQGPQLIRAAAQSLKQFDARRGRDFD